MQLHFRKIGSGCPLVILHGLYGSGDNWYSIGKSLSKHFAVYLVDQRNHGMSPQHASLNYEVLTLDLEEFFDRENLRKACMIGHSMGGKVAMNFALQHPEKLKKLVILDIALRSYQNLVQTQVHRNIVEALFMLDILHTSDRSEIDKKLAERIPQAAVRQFLLKNLKRNERNDFYWGLNIMALQDNLEELFREIQTGNMQFTGPVMVVGGNKSGYISNNDKIDFLKAFPDLRFEMLNAGHWLHVEQPDKLIELLLDFLPEQ
jgi:esterase